MAELGVLDCLQTGLGTLERVRFFPRQLLSADDMIADQYYFREKIRRHNRFLHGWGVVCGLQVAPDPTRGIPWRVRIDPGYAIDGNGDDILVDEPVYLDVAQCGPGARTDPCEPDRMRGGGAAGRESVYVTIKYAECVARPVRAMPAGCACEEVACEYSRIRDSFQIECRIDPPPMPRVPALCDFVAGRDIMPCLPCPTDPSVVLAKITLPMSSTDKIGARQIDHTSSFRRQIFSTAVLQAQLIACCCDREPPATPLQITEVRFIGVPGEFGTLGSPASVPSFSASVDPAQIVSAIQVTFSKPIEIGSVTATPPATATFSVMRIRSLGGDVEDFVIGSIQKVNDLTVRFILRDEQSFRPGAYRVILYGEEGRAIMDTDGGRLDGDPVKIPSGDGTEGGNFLFEFSIMDEPA